MSARGAPQIFKMDFLSGLFKRTIIFPLDFLADQKSATNPQQIRCGQSKKVRCELIRTLLADWRSFSLFFVTKMSTAPPPTCGGSAANPPQIFGSAADSGEVCSRSAGVRGKNTPGGSARGPPEVRADPRRTRVRPFNSRAIHHHWRQW